MSPARTELPGESPRVAVITPYHTESLEVLERARRSVERQTVPCRHIMVADGHPRPEIAQWPVEHIILPQEHRDSGNFGRGIGALHAASTGATAVAFLDADNWYEPSHLSSLLAKAAETDALVCTSARTLRRLDGSILSALDPESDGERFADTSTLFICGGAFDALLVWLKLPPGTGACGDQIVWAAIKRQGYRTAHTGMPSLHYQTRYAVHYLSLGEAPPPGTVDNAAIVACERLWSGLDSKFRNRILSSS